MVQGAVRTRVRTSHSRSASGPSPPRLRRLMRAVLVVTLLCAGLVSARVPGVAVGAAPHGSVLVAAGGDIHNIKHVVVIMQENRSFDSYFGTYPGADGIPIRDELKLEMALKPLSTSKPDEFDH